MYFEDRNNQLNLLHLFSDGVTNNNTNHICDKLQYHYVVNTLIICPKSSNNIQHRI